MTEIPTEVNTAVEEAVDVATIVIPCRDRTSAAVLPISSPRTQKLVEVMTPLLWKTLTHQIWQGLREVDIATTTSAVVAATSNTEVAGAAVDSTVAAEAVVVSNVAAVDVENSNQRQIISPSGNKARLCPKKIL